MKGVVVLLALCLVGVYADLPVHCVRHQIIGKWKLFVGAPQLNGMGQLSCGHQVPDSDKSSYRAGWNDFQSTYNIELHLSDDYEVQRIGDDVPVGKWTMVYDEGFEIQYKNTKYFAFSKYQPDGGSHATSFCDKTLIGWYNNHDNNDRGCYYAEKSENVEASKSLDQVSVVQPKYMSDEDLSRLSMVQISQKEDDSREMSIEDHEHIVNTINNSGRKWKAKVYDHMVGKSFAQLNKLAGRKKYYQGAKFENKPSFVQMNTQGVDDLPKSMNWKELLQPARSQEECGSCYTIAAMAMLSARLRKQGEDVTLSVQHSLNCNYYNQGCDGGYPFLVSKWAQEEYLITEQDEPYRARNGDCNMDKVEKAENVYGVRDYRYIGGGYGLGSERDIMLEIMANGPIIMNFEPTFEFMYYTTGIYHSHDADWVKAGEDRPEWEKVDHSVLCYGWGEEDGEKYWLLQNSWGPDWGEDGNFRMRRGTDESAIESMAEAADPIRLQKKPMAKPIQTNNFNLISFAQQKQNLRMAQ